MKSSDEYDALLQKFLKCMVWDRPEENPYYLWLESRRNDPSAQNELTFAHFIKHSIKDFYEGA